MKAPAQVHLSDPGARLGLHLALRAHRHLERTARA